MRNAIHKEILFVSSFLISIYLTHSKHTKIYMYVSNILSNETTNKETKPGDTYLH